MTTKKVIRFFLGKGNEPPPQDNPGSATAMVNISFSAGTIDKTKIFEDLSGNVLQSTDYKSLEFTTDRISMKTLFTVTLHYSGMSLALRHHRPKSSITNRKFTFLFNKSRLLHCAESSL